MVKPFKFEALADGSANVYKEDRFIANVLNAGELGIHCDHRETETVKFLSSGEQITVCQDCGKTQIEGERYK